MLLLIFTALPVAAEIAVLPFRVANPSEYLKESEGGEYAKILSTGAMIKKMIVIHSPDEISLDMKRIGVRADDSITSEHLNRIGKSLRLDYIILGTLARAGGKYISETILYSAREKKVLFKNKNSSPSMFKLAEADIVDLLTLYPDRKLAASGETSQEVDAVFLIDASYTSAPDGEFIKSAVSALAADMIDTRGIDSRIYIIPFSEKSSYEKASLSENSIINLKTSLSGIRFAGAQNGRAFEKLFVYAVNSIRWRKKAVKSIVIITGSSLDTAANSPSTARSAASRGIKIHIIKLGALTPKDSSMADSLAKIGGGRSGTAVYRQKIFGPDGDESNLYFEGGRVFETISRADNWKDGIFETSKHGSRGKPRRGYDEVLDQAREKPTPANMAALYDKYYSKRIINKGEIECGLDKLLIEVIAPDRAGSKIRAADESIIGRVLLSDGNNSVWVSVQGEAMLIYFEEKKSGGMMFYAGVSILSDPSESYGSKFRIESIHIPHDFLPDCLKADLSDMLKNREKFSGEGLFAPPVWFINVKVEEIRKIKSGKDIRD